MSARRELRSDQRRFSGENIGPNGCKFVSPLIAIAIAGGLAKIIVGDLMFAIGVENPGRILQRSRFDLHEPGLQFFQDTVFE